MINTIRTGQPLSQPQIDKAQDKVQVLNQKAGSEPSPLTSGVSSSTRSEITLSSQAKALGQLHQTMADAPPFDTQKIAEIKQQISQGNYKVNAENLARNMISFES